ETRSRVLEAVDQLGYVPSIGAQQLAAGRSQSIGLLIRDSRNPVYGLLQSQVQKWADEFGLHVVTAMPTFYRGGASGDDGSAPADRDAGGRLADRQRRGAHRGPPAVPAHGSGGVGGTP